MARLKQLAPRMGSLAARGSRPGRKVELRDRVSAWRAWYHTTRWRKLRWSVLADAGFRCKRCGFVSCDGTGSDLVADHVTPHRGDAALFWDRDNLQPLCIPCHSGDKQREERAADGATVL